MADDVRVVASGSTTRRRGVSTGTVLAVIAALLIGLLVGRLTSGGGDDSPPTPKRGQDVGPTRSVNGVPVGYAHSREGAVAALLNYGAVLSDPNVLLDERRRADVLRLIATPRYASTFRGEGAAALDAVKQSPLGRGLTNGARTVYFGTPISYRVQTYDGDSATVVGWGVSVVGNDQGLAPQATWGTTITTAKWQDGDWKVDAVRTIGGPVPKQADGQRPSDADAFLSRLGDARGLRHAP